jgi:Fe-Mn family superoxide dismutase
MGPESGLPTGRFAVALEEAFGSIDEFKDKFEAAGVNRFGSGWAWLVLDGSGTLVVTSTPNQDNPLMDVAPVRGTPLLGNDVWEHAYYLRYNNRRADYLKAWWDVVDWEKVAERYEQALG